MFPIKTYTKFFFTHLTAIFDDKNYLILILI